MREDLPHGHVALLLTDIEGSTRLLHRLGAEGYAAAQAQHRTLLRAAFRAHGGVEVDTQGDAFFYVFPDTARCLAGAVAGTRALARHPWPQGDAVRVRMGMHCGEPQPTDEGYVGLVVNTAARVSAVGHGGQILLSAAAAAEAAPALDGIGITLKPLGQHRLKDLDVPETLFQAVIPELPADFPPPRSAELRPNNLPTPLTPFVGRARLVAQVSDLVLAPATRLVTLLGPGGTGKSRLGLQVARELLHSLEDGAFFVGLAPLRDAALVLPAVAAAVGVKEEPGRPLEQTLAQALAEKRLLLLLDNFEHVPGAARALGGLLAGCPGVKVIATSRQPLQLKGERRVPVPGMTLPEDGAPLDAIAESEAVRLFIETAQEAAWDFQLDEDNAAAVVQICRRVDALPLAIELATAKLATMSVAELLDALDTRLEVLTDGSVDLLDHQQTLRDLIAWSYDLLEPAEQRLWCRLAVFSGGATLEAVQAVCDPDGEYRFPRDVDNLVQKSLANLEFGERTPGAGAGAGKRVVLLETLREYALERLGQAPEAQALRGRHLAWYHAFADSLAAGLRGPEAPRHLASLDRDLDNLRTAMSFGFSRPEDKAAAAALAGALWFYFYERGLFQEGRRWLAEAADADVPPGARGVALLGLANLDRVQGRHEPALRHGEAALDAFRAAGDEAGIADALGQLGAILQHQGDMARAAECLDEAVPLLRRLGRQSRLAFTLVLLGALRQLEGDLAGAEAHYAESLAIGRELDDGNAIATALVNLGELERLRGDDEAAAARLRESLALYHALGVRNAIAYCLELLAGIDIDAGQSERAAALLGAADRLRELLDAPVEPFNRERYDRDLARAKAGAGEAEFAAAWAGGRRLTLPDALALAGASSPAPP